MEENEFILINYAIIARFNKEIKELKKIYQATIDGDRSSDFHRKCDKIPNTLVLIKSAGNRRFGGFTTQTWDFWDYSQEGNLIKMLFYFHLIKKKFILVKKENMLFFVIHKMGHISAIILVFI